MQSSLPRAARGPDIGDVLPTKQPQKRSRIVATASLMLALFAMLTMLAPTADAYTSKSDRNNRLSFGYSQVGSWRSTDNHVRYLVQITKNQSRGYGNNRAIVVKSQFRDNKWGRPDIHSGWYNKGNCYVKYSHCNKYGSMSSRWDAHRVSYGRLSYYQQELYQGNVHFTWWTH